MPPKPTRSRTVQGALQWDQPNPHNTECPACLGKISTLFNSGVPIHEGKCGHAMCRSEYEKMAVPRTCPLCRITGYGKRRGGMQSTSRSGATSDYAQESARRSANFGQLTPAAQAALNARADQEAADFRAGVDLRHPSDPIGALARLDAANAAIAGFASQYTPAAAQARSADYARRLAANQAQAAAQYEARKAAEAQAQAQAPDVADSYVTPEGMDEQLDDDVTTGRGRPGRGDLRRKHMLHVRRRKEIRGGISYPAASIDPRLHIPYEGPMLTYPSNNLGLGPGIPSDQPFGLLVQPPPRPLNPQANVYAPPRPLNPQANVYVPRRGSAKSRTDMIIDSLKGPVPPPPPRPITMSMMDKMRQGTVEPEPREQLPTKLLREQYEAEMRGREPAMPNISQEFMDQAAVVRFMKTYPHLFS